jgi:hypothetical protein
MPKFNAEDPSFVHVATHDQEIMMVLSVKEDVMNRYDLQSIDGTVYRNIGEYELTIATEDEVVAALNKKSTNG